MSQRSTLIVFALLTLVAFTLLSRYVNRGGMKSLDFAVTVKVQERIDNSSRLRLARLTGEIMEGATFLASPLVSVISITVITFMTFIKRKKFRVVAFVIPLAFGLMTLAEIYGKASVHHPAPPFFLLKNPTTVFPKYYVWEDYSYPSGHAARAVFLAIVIFSLFAYHFSLMKKPLWRWRIYGVLGAYVGIVALSRIYLGHHWLSDIMGGGLLGLSLGTAAIGPLVSGSALRGRLPDQTRPPDRRL